MKQFKAIRWICNDCEWDWKTLAVNVKDSQETEQCPSCASFDVRESITAPSVKFDGDGFYETDYK